MDIQWNEDIYRLLLLRIFNVVIIDKIASSDHYNIGTNGRGEKIMNLIKSRKGQLGGNVIEKAILAIVLLVVLLQLYATLIPEAQTAGDALNASGVPLGGLFVAGGVIFVIIMAALVILVVKSFMSGTKR